MKILLSEMFHKLYEELAQPPYAASFFYSYVNQEYLDDSIPELTVLRQALANISPQDFAFLHTELHSFLKLREEVLAKIASVNSYKEVLNKYCDLIKAF